MSIQLSQYYCGISRLSGAQQSDFFDCKHEELFKAQRDAEQTAGSRKTTIALRRMHNQPPLSVSDSVNGGFRELTVHEKTTHMIRPGDEQLGRRIISFMTLMGQTDDTKVVHTPICTEYATEYDPPADYTSVQLPLRREVGCTFKIAHVEALLKAFVSSDSYTIVNQCIVDIL